MVHQTGLVVQFIVIGKELISKLTKHVLEEKKRHLQTQRRKVCFSLYFLTCHFLFVVKVFTFGNETKSLEETNRVDALHLVTICIRYSLQKRDSGKSFLFLPGKTHCLGSCQLCGNDLGPGDDFGGKRGQLGQLDAIVIHCSVTPSQLMSVSQPAGLTLVLFFG